MEQKVLENPTGDEGLNFDIIKFEKNDILIENFTCNNKPLSNNINNVINKLMENSTTIQHMNYLHSKEDFKTICILIREAVFLKKGINSHANTPISFVYSPRYSSCVLLFIQNPISNESFTAHIDINCIIDLTETVSLFENKEKFKINLYFFKFEHISEDDGSEFYDRNLIYSCKSSKIHLIEENMGILKNIINEVICFVQKNINCAIEIKFSNHPFTDITKGEDFIVDLNNGISYLDISVNDYSVSEKYYPPVDTKDVINTPIHMRNMYNHEYYTYILSSKISKIITIYNNKFKEELFPNKPKMLLSDEIVNEINSMKEKDEIIKKLFALSKDELLPKIFFKDFFRIRDELIARSEILHIFCPVNKALPKNLLIKATQDGIVRFCPMKNNQTEVFTEIFLLTDNIRNCVCLYIKGLDGRLSLIHIDEIINITLLNNELKWIGKLDKIILVKNKSNNKNKDLIEKIKRYFNTNVTCEACDGLCVVNQNGERDHQKENNLLVKCVDLKLPKSLYFVNPLEDLRHSILMLNHVFKDVSLDLQYDGNDWTKLPKLNNTVKNLVNSWKKNPNKDNKDLINSSKDVTNENIISLGEKNTKKMESMFNLYFPKVREHIKVYLEEYTKFSNEISSELKKEFLRITGKNCMVDINTERCVCIDNDDTLINNIFNHFSDRGIVVQEGKSSKDGKPMVQIETIDLSFLNSMPEMSKKISNAKLASENGIFTSLEHNEKKYQKSAIPENTQLKELEILTSTINITTTTTTTSISGFK